MIIREGWVRSGETSLAVDKLENGKMSTFEEESEKHCSIAFIPLNRDLGRSARASSLRMQS